MIFGLISVILKAQAALEPPPARVSGLDYLKKLSLRLNTSGAGCAFCASSFSHLIGLLICFFMSSPPFYGYIITENGYKVKQKGYKFNYFLTKNIDAITQKGYNKNKDKGGDIMGIDNKVKMVMASANVNSRQLAAALDISPQGAANRISRGITSIKDLIRIVDYCGGSVTITTKDGTVIPLSTEDIIK